MYLKSVLYLMIMLPMLYGCATYQPANTHNICDIFNGKISWYEEAVDANKKWGTPIWVIMAIMRHESQFKRDVRPPRRYVLGFIPWGYKSSAYGYAQAKNEVWNEYLQARNRWALRDNFGDAIDFIGWYTHHTQRQLNISKWDVYNQYLAYHEGRGGYKRGSFKKKKWLIGVAEKVKRTSQHYQQQLKGCKKTLDKRISGWF